MSPGKTDFKPGETDDSGAQWTPAWKDRFAQILKKVGGLKGAAELIGTKTEQIGKWRDGKARPPFFALQTLADAAGKSLDWLATGAEPTQRPTAPSEQLDDELFGRLIDAIQRLYKEEHIGLAPIDLGRIASRKYGEITAATGDPEERGAMVKLVVTQLRAEIRKARAEPGTGKASA